MEWTCDRKATLFLTILLQVFTFSQCFSLFHPPPLRTLLIDNFDSYTYNIWQQVAEINENEPIVVHNNAFSNWDDLITSLPPFDNIILSPGPGSPDVPSDFGLCKDAIRFSKVPILGVCLGHQGIGMFYGGKVIKASVPMHGRLSKIHHDGSALFEGIPDAFDVVRYHSLKVEQLPSCLKRTAWTEDGTIMGLQHETKPQYGVQFHPESVKTEYGKHIFQNFRRLSIHYKNHLQPNSVDSMPNYPHRLMNNERKIAEAEKKDAKDEGIMIKSVFVDVVELDSTRPFNITMFFQALYKNEPAAIWLDSETMGPTKEQQSLPRNSYFAAMDTDEAFVMESRHSTVGTIFRYRNGSSVHQSSHLLSILNQELLKNKDYLKIHYLTENSEHYGQNLSFIDGYFGYLGYELGKEISQILSSRNGFRSKITDADFQALLNNHRKINHNNNNQVASNISYPLAFLLFPSRYVVYNHQENRLYVVAHRSDDNRSISSVLSSDVVAAGQALKHRVVKALSVSQRDISSSGTASPIYSNATAACLSVNRPTLVAKKTFQSYKDDIHKCLSYIQEGETYEVCLTVQFKGKLPVVRDPFPDYSLQIYQKLRSFNPAPYSAFIRYDGSTSHSLHTSPFAVCCTSPEQYLRKTKDGVITSKPIKGTSKRARNDPQLDQTLADILKNDPKSQAENLMIVDLVRNDLGRICEVGSVHVPTLFGIESYSTVHQLVSTIQGKLCDNYTMVDAFIHTFPPGSMTGAPKLRTMQIIEELEQQPRGIYSGTIGFIGLNGVSDLNVVIRTAVVEEDAITIGAGGAIVAQSNPNEEIDEVLLKAKAVGNSIGFDVNFAKDTEKEEKK